MIEIKLLKKNANVTVYVSKKDTLQPSKGKQRKFCEKHCRFVVTEFVQTCDEPRFRMYDDLLRDYHHLKRQNKKLNLAESEPEKQPCDRSED